MRMLSQVKRAERHIADIGVTPRHDHEETRRLRVSNRISATSSFFALAYAPLFAFASNHVFTGITLFLAMVLGLPLWLNQRGRPVLARHCLVGLLAGSVFLYGGSMPPETSNWVYQFAFSALPWMLFDVSERKHLALSVSMPTLCLALGHTSLLTWMPETRLDPTWVPVMFWANIATSLGLLGSCSWALASETHRSHRLALEHAKELEKRAAREVAAAVKKQRFLANMSHELRTPLNGMLGLSELFEAEGVNEEQRRQLAMIRSSGRSLLTIVDDILDFAKIDAGSLGLEQIPTDIAQLAIEVTELIGARVHSSEVSIHCKVDSEAHGYYSADPVRLRQVLVNLVGNAAKFTKQGEVRLELSRTNDALHFAVHDTGIGISEARLQSLFEEFSQGGNSVAREYGGTGLGLTISRRLVQLMGSDIEVESKLGTGSCFSFALALPIAKAPLPAPPSSSGTSLAFGRRVLLVEDNKINQLVAQKMLEKLGCVVELAEDGGEAIDKTNKGEFDVVLMDCQMPTIDGLEATRTIRAREGIRGSGRMPVIAMTADVTQERRKACFEAGMDDWCTKPIQAKDLEQIVAKWAA